VLPDGRESTVRLSRGASRARSAYPNFAGRGDAPFGKDLPASLLKAGGDPDVDDDAASEVADDAEKVTETEPVAENAPRPIRRRARVAARTPAAAEETITEIVETVAQAETEESVEPDEPPETNTDEAGEEPAEQTPDVAQPAAAVEPEAPSPRPTRPNQAEPSPRTPEVKMAESPRTVEAPASSVTRTAPDGASRTETLARAYLQAIETRRELDRSGVDGFEGLVLAGIAGIVDELAGLFERRLRGERPDRQHSADWLQQRFIVLDWFRAVVNGHEPMAALSADLQSLVDTAVTLFGADEEQAAA
jgi:hypothetical protein